jgi:VWFA-related protein
MSKFLGTMLMCNRLSRLLLPLFLVTTIYAPNLLFGLSTPSGSQESSNLTYHSTVSEVRLVFFATDEHNHSVEGLQKDDFAVVDDEMVIRDFRSFTRSDLIKLDVIVLIDSSESVLPHFEQEITDVVQLISQCPWGPEDNLSVLSFSGMEAHFVCAGNCRSSFTADRLASLPKGGATPLFDAVEIAANFLIQRRQPDVWPVIILFSDGEDTISKASFHGALEKILASEAQIYAIDISSPGRPSNGTATLQRIADDSGGRRVRISEGAVRIFNDVIDDLHSARVVTYVLPESSSDFHSIRILPTHNLKLQFRCRRGYYYHDSGSAHSEDGP